MTTLLAVFTASVLMLSASVSWAEIYKWTDESGTAHFSDSLSSVPPKYRGQIERRDSGKAKSETPPDTRSLLKEKVPVPENVAPKKYEIPYEAFEGSARRVIVNVRFNDRVTAPMVLDTGAPSMTISTRLAERLALLDKSEGRMLTVIGGIGGKQQAIRTFISQIQVGEIKEEFIAATIADWRSSAHEGIIGMDFLGNYAFTINPAKRVVELTEIPERKNYPGGRDEGWWRSNYQELNAYQEMWKGWIGYFEKEIQAKSMFPDEVKRLKEYRAFCEWQYKESDDLIWKLTRFAREHSVPMHWRR